MLARLTLADSQGVIREADLGARPAELQAPIAAPAGTLRDSMRARIRNVYRETDGNVSETARRLRVSRNTIYRALPAARGSDTERKDAR